MIKSRTDLLNAKAFLISKDNTSPRWNYAYNNIKNAGFHNVIYFRGLFPNTEEYNKEKQKYKIDYTTTIRQPSIHHPGMLGCTLSHLKLWENIINENIPYAVIFEDDIEFKPDWFTTKLDIAVEKTPCDYDILYIGSKSFQLSYKEICILPVYTTSAYIITYQGAQKILSYIKNLSLGIYTIDAMLYDSMTKSVCNYKELDHNFKWYVWNVFEKNKKIPDEDKYPYKVGMCYGFGFTQQSDSFISQTGCIKVENLLNINDVTRLRKYCRSVHNTGTRNTD
jgi:GR25 family glycosyltransferase involved in LPS biosynthesis